MDNRPKEFLALDLRSAVRSLPDLPKALEGRRAADIADAMADVSDPDALAVFKSLDDERAADVLFHVEPGCARYIVANTPRERVVRLLAWMPMDDAARVVAKARPEEAQALLNDLDALAPEDAADVRSLLSYKPKTAGRLMTRKFVRLSPELKVGEAFDLVRHIDATVETVTTLYVTDANSMPLGVISMRDLLRADPVAAIAEVMTRDLVTVTVDTAQEEVAKLIARYDFLTVPVIGESGTLLGIITVDDVIDILIEEFREDVSKITGSDADEIERKSPVQIALLRLPWILATMFIELGAGVVIHIFDATLTKVILLASFMPIISAISGNTGLQSAAIIIRGLSTGHVQLGHWKHAVLRQLGTTVVLAAACASTLGVIGAVWDRRLSFGIVVAFGMFLSMNIAGIVGTVIPMTSKRLGYDPALTAGPFETAFQDVVGITIFLAFATAMMPLLK